MLHDIIIYGLMIVFYSVFFVLVKSSFQNKSSHLRDILKSRREMAGLMNNLLAGILILGIGSVSILAKSSIPDSIFEFPLKQNQHTAWIITVILAFIIGTKSATHKSIHENFTPSFLSLNTALLFLLIRTLFLIVYEFFFRAVLLFIMIDKMGVIAAIVLNILLYTGVHWFNKTERYGSIPMGIILCSMAFYYQSVWPAVIIHLALALSHETKLLVQYRTSFKQTES